MNSNPAFLNTSRALDLAVQNKTPYQPFTPSEVLTWTWQFLHDLPVVDAVPGWHVVKEYRIGRTSIPAKTDESETVNFAEFTSFISMFLAASADHDIGFTIRPAGCQRSPIDGHEAVAIDVWVRDGASIQEGAS